MHRRYFGTHGIRGTVGHGSITPDFMLRLGQALGPVLRRPGARPPSVLIGRDTRLSGEMLEAALRAGLSSAGVDVLLCGVLPTPGVACLTRALRRDLGIVIGGSHHPFHDNGIRFFSADGGRPGDEWEARVEAALGRPTQPALAARPGRIGFLADAPSRCIGFYREAFGRLSLDGLELVLDAAHGAAHRTAPAVLRERGARVHALGCAPDGLNINEACGVLHPQALVEAVRALGADYGIALDGEAERLRLAGRGGRLHDDDDLLWAMVTHRLARGEAVPGVVGTQMTNMGVELALQARGIPLVRARKGSRHVRAELLARGWKLGSAGSGRLVALDRHATADGLLGALEVLGAVVRSGRSLAELLEDVPRFPQVLVKVHLAPGQAGCDRRRLAAERASVAAELRGQGRVLIGPSPTGPSMQVMVEARDGDLARRCAERLAFTLQG